MSKLSPFHLAIPVSDLNESKKFYEEILGCSPGRFSEEWADYNFFGHQLVIHLDPNHKGKVHHNEVDGKSVPVPHFGVIIPWNDFDKFADNISKNNIQFIIEPYLKFKGLPGEQKTLFFYDNSGNALEFKSFKNMNMLFSNEL
ncbi:MAG: VOC family protein [Bacteroidota bacterium]|nr:VOC family protein [Bacteroidota bacterium]MEC9065169.1 VOC family protein [Bacteroidota bacterium]MED5269371.1 VOC family protein [Bacteroidota bacterium]|tara:strand:+ start:81 stop:509 length:429 start_codon:yes stop_codon:yes gene_type:complete